MADVNVRAYVSMGLNAYKFLSAYTEISKKPEIFHFGYLSFQFSYNFLDNPKWRQKF